MCISRVLKHLQSFVPLLKTKFLEIFMHLFRVKTGEGKFKGVNFALQ